METEGFNIDSFVVAEQAGNGRPSSPTPSPVTGGTPAPVLLGGGAYGGVPVAIPGGVEAEEFDIGGEGVGYSDVDPGNIGGVSEINEHVVVT